MWQISSTSTPRRANSLSRTRKDIRPKITSSSASYFSNATAFRFVRCRMTLYELKEQERAVLTEAVITYGADAQEWVFVGEVGELLDAIADHKRGRATRDNIAEEIADVEIMLEQLKIIYKIDGSVSFWRQKKIARLAENLRKGDAERT